MSGARAKKVRKSEEARPKSGKRPAAKSKRAPKSAYKLLAVDLDGTLLDHDGKPHDEDVRAIQALMESGIPVAIITGRLYSGTRPTAEIVGIRGPVACADGSHVVRVETDETLVHHGIRGPSARKLRDAVVRNELATFLFAEDAIVYDGAGEAYLPYLRTWSSDMRRAASIVDDPMWKAATGLTAVVALGPEAAICAAVDDIHKGCRDKAQVSAFPVKRVPGNWGLIARASAGTKGTALEWLAEHHGCTLAETVTVGDWLNDVPMFAVSGRAFAMGQAPDVVKQVATDVLEETSDGGGGIARVVAECFGVAW
jgi:Cof subfamily protein (haloacid dehalogenase superfamily)